MNALRKIYRSVFPVNPLAKHTREGSLVVGSNCDLTRLTVSFPPGCEGKSNLIIGSDCILACHIIIYNPDVKIIIGNRVFIGHETTLFANNRIELKDDILISWGCTLIDTNAHPLKWDDRKMDVINWRQGKKDWTNVENKPVIIENKCWIGFNSIILKGVTVGEGAVVAAGSVVTKRVDPLTIVGGNPAELLKTTE